VIRHPHFLAKDRSGGRDKEVDPLGPPLLRFPHVRVRVRRRVVAQAALTSRFGRRDLVVDCSAGARDRPRQGIARCKDREIALNQAIWRTVKGNAPLPLVLCADRTRGTGSPERARAGASSVRRSSGYCVAQCVVSGPSSRVTLPNGLNTNRSPPALPPQRMPASFTSVLLVISKTSEPLSPAPTPAETNVWQS